MSRLFWALLAASLCLAVIRCHMSNRKRGVLPFKGGRASSAPGGDKVHYRGSKEVAVSEMKRRQRHLFSLFTVLTFPNEACAGSGSGDTGTCVTSSECASKGKSSYIILV